MNGLIWKKQDRLSDENTETHFLLDSAKHLHASVTKRRMPELKGTRVPKFQIEGETLKGMRVTDRANFDIERMQRICEMLVHFDE